MHILEYRIYLAIREIVRVNCKRLLKDG